MEIAAPITLTEAKGLIDVLDNDIPEHEKSKVAFLLLILSANPELAKVDNIITDKKSSRTKYDYGWWGGNGYNADDYGEC